MVDVPCGDFAWMQYLRADVHYIGGDVIPELVEANDRRWGGPQRRFETIDLITGDLPEGDLLLCRDCLVHLSYDDALAALRNIGRSRCRWLLTTTFPGSFSTGPRGPRMRPPSPPGLSAVRPERST